MGRVAVLIPFWVVTLNICLALYRPMFNVLARCSGVIILCLELLNALFAFLAIFSIALSGILFDIGYVTRTDDTSRSYMVDSTNDPDLEPRTKSDSYSIVARVRCSQIRLAALTATL